MVNSREQNFSHVEEGLGTKNLVADAMAKITGKSYYNQVAQDTVAMIVNDMITLGNFPITLAMHLAVGSSDWFKNEKRVYDLIEGWGKACDQAGCIWAGGETPTLKDIIYPEASLLSGSAIGISKAYLDPINIDNGDIIIFLEASGIHANGLTLARKIADKLPKGYETELSDGRMYGEALLDPTHIYCKFLEMCVNTGVNIHYAVNITGHGWRKLMRAQEPFSYVIEKLPKQLPIFDFIQEHGPVTDEESYGNLNMGAGFALFVPASEVKKIPIRISNKFRSFVAGYIEKSPVKRVVIKPKGLEYKSETLAVR
jgi:phosphoribosylformylglycinamidine cyclo-ligase